MQIKETPTFIKKGTRQLSSLTKLIALVLSVILIGAASVLTYQTFVALLNLDTKTAIQDGLFVMIVLEMLYVIYSFIKYGSINVSIVINVGIIAVVKEMVFSLENLNLQVAGSYALVIVSLSIGYLVEMLVFEKKKKGIKI